MFDWQDLFQWDRFITPTIIKIFYWLAVGISVLAGLSGIFGGLAAMVVNPFAGFIGILISLASVAAGIIFARIAQGLRHAGEEPSLERAILVGALGASVAFCVHNTFDNMFIHGIGVQFGAVLGLVEITARRLTSGESPVDGGDAHRDSRAGFPARGR